jgi:hypothetical protein
MMRTDGLRDARRPRGAVLRPLGLLLAAVVTGFGMWHVLMQDGRSPRADRHVGRNGHTASDRLHGAE